MLYDDKYTYIICDEYCFNSAYLNLEDKSLYKKYILVFYKDNGKLKKAKVFNYGELKKIKFDILIKYYIEEINITDLPFESEYKYSHIYNIKNIGYIKKVIPEFDYEYHCDNEEVKTLMDSYEKNWKELDEKFFEELL